MLRYDQKKLNLRNKQCFIGSVTVHSVKSWNKC